MRFGISIGGDKVAENARRFESLGFDSLWAGDHVIAPVPIHPALVVLTAAAAVTQRVRVGTAVLLLPLKHPVLVAKAASAVDHIARGRFALGVGIGGEYASEFEAMGVPRAERGARANESLEVIKRLWTEDRVTFRGRFFQMADVTLQPKPVQKPHPPILVGGRRGSLDRTARYADGWIPYIYSSQMYHEHWRRIEDLAAAYGRDPSGIERLVYCFITVDRSYEAALAAGGTFFANLWGQDFQAMMRKYVIVGTPEQCAERIQEYHEAGAEHVIFVPAAPGDRAANFPEIIAKDIIPAWRKGAHPLSSPPG